MMSRRACALVCLLPMFAVAACARGRATPPDGDGASQPGEPVQVGAPSASTTESGGPATFDVVLTIAPTSEVRITLSSADPTEGAVMPAELVFTGDTWSMPQTVTVTGLDDDVDDGDQTYAIVLGAPATTDPVFGGLVLDDVAITNLDDDTAALVVTPATTTTTEGGGSATFTVALASEPTADVTLMLASDDGSEGIAGEASLTFTPAAWDLAQPVTVTGVDDPDVDGDVAYQIVLSGITSADPVYAALIPASIDLVNLDDEILCTTLAGCWPGDDFDDGNFTGFTTHGLTTTIDSMSGAAGSTRSLQVTGGSVGQHQNGARRTWTGCQPSRFTVWVRPDASASARNYVVLGPPTGATPTNTIVFLYVTADNQWTAFGSTSISLGNAVPDVWMRVDIDFDWTSRTYDIRFDDTLVRQDVAFRVPGLSQLGQADFYNFGSATGRWDEIQLFCP